MDIAEEDFPEAAAVGLVGEGGAFLALVDVLISRQ